MSEPREVVLFAVVWTMRFPSGGSRLKYRAFDGGMTERTDRRWLTTSREVAEEMARRMPPLLRKFGGPWRVLRVRSRRAAIADGSAGILPFGDAS